MKILFITLNPYNSNNSAMIRNNALINGLIDHGHEVELLTIQNNENSNFFDEKLEWNNVCLNIIDNIPIGSTVLKKSKDNFKSKIKFIVKKFAKFIYHRLAIFDSTIFLIKKINIDVLYSDYYDVIISSSDPKSSHILAEKFINQGLKYRKWLQYWGDPLTIDITNKTWLPRYYLKYKELQLIKRASKIIYVSPFTLEAQKKLFPRSSEKMEFLPIAYNRTIMSNKELDINEIKIGYFGDYFSNIRNILPLIKSANDYGKSIKLFIAGNSDLLLERNQNLIVYPRLNSEKILDLELQMDILIVILNNHGTQIPGKLYHYSATNKPILVICEKLNKKMKEYLSSFNRFIICENDSSHIIKEIEKIKITKHVYMPLTELSRENIALKIIEIGEDYENITS